MHIISLILMILSRKDGKEMKIWEEFEKNNEIKFI